MPSQRHVLPGGAKPPTKVMEELIGILRLHADWMVASAHLGRAERKAASAQESFQKAKDRLSDAKHELMTIHPGMKVGHLAVRMGSR